MCRREYRHALPRAENCYLAETFRRMAEADGRRQTADGRRQMADGRRQMAEGRRQTTDDRRQTTDDRRQTTDDRACLPRPARGERVGVRGTTTTLQQPVRK